MVRTHDFTRVRAARTFTERLVGLIDSDRTSLYISSCRSIHTCFMRVPIDVVFLNHAGMVVRVIERARPWSVFFGPAGTRSVLELPAGETKKLKVGVGDVILRPRA